MSIRFRGVKAIAAASVLLAAAGCTDTLVEPKSTVTEANIFTDASSYLKLIAKLYAGLAVTGQEGPHGNADIVSNDEGFMSYTRLLWNLNELPTDETALAWGDLAIQELNQNIWATTNSFIQAMYYRIFYQVVLANEFLRQTTDEKLDSRGHSSSKPEVAFYRAEARFLRALSYWHAIDLFGDVPHVTEADPVGGPAPAQGTRADVYNYVVQELTEIIPQLPAPGAATYGRANQIAGHMLLAKVYLNAQVYTGTAEWAKALTESQAVIAGPFTLNPHWRYNFLADNHTANEIVFPVTQDGKNTKNWGGTTFLVHAGCGGDGFNNNTVGVNSCWWGFRLKPEAYRNFFPPAQPAGDTARTSFFYGSTVGMANLQNFQHGVAAPKFSNRTSAGVPGSDVEFPDTDYPMFRLADAYLMYAEAAVRGGGNVAQALTYVNQLRRRVYGNTSGDITGPQLTLDFILAERSRELLFEGHRRQDLIRFGKFTGNTYLWAWKGGIQAGTSIDATRALYPIPASELVANPNLRQNPGY